MNRTIRDVLLFGAGFAAGAYVMHTVFRTKYQEYADAQIDDMRDHYRKKEADLDTMIEEKAQQKSMEQLTGKYRTESDPEDIVTHDPIFVRILRQAVLANIIKERMLLLQFDPGGGRGVISRIIPGGRVLQKFFEFFVLEAAVVAAHPFAVHILGTFFVIREIVHQFFTERSPGVRIRNLCLLIVGVVHCPGTFSAIRHLLF